MNKRRNIIKLKVKKIKDSLSFYKTIGFTIPSFKSLEHPLIIYGGGGEFDLSLIPADHPVDEEIGIFDFIQVFYPTPNDVDEAFRKTAIKGFETVTKPWNTFWGTRSAKVLDPDGNSILLFTHLK